jgi:hypothetical protein
LFVSFRVCGFGWQHDPAPPQRFASADGVVLHKLYSPAELRRLPLGVQCGQGRGLRSGLDNNEPDV